MSGFGNLYRALYVEDVGECCLSAPESMNGQADQGGEAVRLLLDKFHSKKTFCCDVDTASRP